jgi:hypothetical protein
MELIWILILKKSGVITITGWWVKNAYQLFQIVFSASKIAQKIEMDAECEEVTGNLLKRNKKLV